MPPDVENTVLVADDDADVLNLVRFRLERDGLRVLTAADGIEALELARAQRPRVCVLDVMMPKLGGLELVQRLREDPGTSSTRIILLTARSADDHVDEGFEFGADDYVTKPFNPQELRGGSAGNSSAWRVDWQRSRGPESSCEKTGRHQTRVASPSRSTSAVSTGEPTEGTTEGEPNKPAPATIAIHPPHGCHLTLGTCGGGSSSARR